MQGSGIRGKDDNIVSIKENADGHRRPREEYTRVDATDRFSDGVNQEVEQNRTEDTALRNSSGRIPSRRRLPIDAGMSTGAREESVEEQPGPATDASLVQPAQNA